MSGFSDPGLRSRPRDAPLRLKYAFNKCPTDCAISSKREWTADKETEKLKYLHRNPVARGLVARPEDWQWSSFRHYATGIEGTIEIESQWTAFRRGNQLPEAFRYKERAG